MTKQEIIEKRWIEILGKENFNSIKIDSDGWLNFDSSKDYHRYSNIYGNKFMSRGYDPWKKGEDSHIQKVSIRPVSLHGLDDNNGWIKIETIENLPKEDGAFWHCDEETIWHTPWTAEKIEYGFKRGLITHYKPVKKIEKFPIY